MVNLPLIPLLLCALRDSLSPSLSLSLSFFPTQVVFCKGFSRELDFRVSTVRAFAFSLGLNTLAICDRKKQIFSDSAKDFLTEKNSDCRHSDCGSFIITAYYMRVVLYVHKKQ